MQICDRHDKLNMKIQSTHTVDVMGRSFGYKQDLCEECGEAFDKLINEFMNPKDLQAALDDDVPF